MSNEENKSNTKYIEIRGEFEWAKVFEQNREREGWKGAYKKHGGATEIDVIMDRENRDILEDSGSQTKAKKQEDGRYKAKFHRKWEAPFTYGGAPQVAKADGTYWDINEDGLIGNGTTGIVFLCVYDTQAGRATRLDGVQVLHHVPYVSDKEYTPPGPRFKDYSSEVEKEEGPVKKSAYKRTVIEDDELPF